MPFSYSGCRSSNFGNFGGIGLTPFGRDRWFRDAGVPTPAILTESEFRHPEEFSFYIDDSNAVFDVKKTFD
ncbi:MAG: hypothetical protein LLF95_04715 [Bacteroidales bacterium]|nr:hypothetical protein [Bacteroidales bacterium]